MTTTHFATRRRLDRLGRVHRWCRWCRNWVMACGLVIDMSSGQTSDSACPPNLIPTCPACAVARDKWLEQGARFPLP